MDRILKSDPRSCFAQFCFPKTLDPETGEELPEVVLPSGRYTAFQRERLGVTNYAKLNDKQQRRLALDPSFAGMLRAHGKAKPMYVWCDDLREIPGYALASSNMTTRLSQENALLRAQIRNLGAEPVSVERPPVNGPRVLTDSDPRASITDEKGEQVGPLKFKDDVLGGVEK